MALTLGDNFSYQGAKPLDGRLKYDTLAAMKAVADATMYEGCMAYCVATDKTYQWKSTNTVDADTGRWREFSSGGGGASALTDLTDTDISSASDGQFLGYDNETSKWKNVNPPSTSDCYKTDDTAETTFADNDYVPFYDTSANGKRKSLWSNIKTVLKTYFDTLYSPLFTISTGLKKYNNVITNPSMVYSSSEQEVGNWIDGSALYKRTFTGLCPSSAGYPNTLFSFSSTYGLKIIKIEGVVYSASAKAAIPFPFYNKDTGDAFSPFYYDGNILCANSGTITSSNGYSYRMTITYYH